MSMPGRGEPGRDIGRDVGGETMPPRRRRSGPPPGRRTGGRRGPGGPAGPGGRGPRDPRDFDDFDDESRDRRRTGWKRFIPSWKIVAAGVTVVAAGIFGMVAVAYARTPMPVAKQDDAVAQASVIYYNDGKTPIARYGTPRVLVDISRVPRHVQDAVVAIENRTFWEDSGISIPGMVRSVWMTVTGQQVQGGSTITQQMARNYYDGLSTEQTLQRKIKEIFVAVKLDKKLSKQQILEQYLNTVNFGRAYGIEAAAQAYFRKHVDKLTVAEGAYLAARIQIPALGAEDPRLKARFVDVVKAMANLDPEKYGNLPATAKFPKIAPEDNKGDLGGIKGYMVNEVLDELQNKRGLSRDKVRTGGYKIVSTFDKRLMQVAKKAVLNSTRSLSKEFHAGLAAVNPKNGRVVAFYGGHDYTHDSWNEAFDSRKQAASAFKPYVLAAWLEAGYSLNSYVPGDKTVPEQLPGTKQTIKNSHNVGHAIDVIQATAQSVNTAYASMAYALPGKLDDVRALAEAAGISKKAIEEDEKGVNGQEGHGYGLAIGSVGVTPVEQAAGYSIFANQGKHVDYHVVQGVWQGDTLVLPELREVKQVISPDAAADATVALQEVLKSGTARGQGIGRPAAGKTGTNNDEKEAWFVGYTPQLVTAVGMYREQCRTDSGKVVQPRYQSCPVTPNGKPSKKYGPQRPYSRAYEVSLGFEGAGPPTTIWRTFMMEALAGKPVEQFPPKAGIGSPHNIVERPTPSPSPESEEFPVDDFPTDDFPTDDIPQGGTDECMPIDPSCGGGSDTGDVGGGDEGGGDIQLDPGAARRDGGGNPNGAPATASAASGPGG